MSFSVPVRKATLAFPILRLLTTVFPLKHLHNMESDVKMTITAEHRNI